MIVGFNDLSGEEISEYVEQAKKSLPSNCFTSEWDVYFGEKQVSNFLPIVKTRVTYVDVHSGDSTESMRLSAIVDGQLVPDIELTITELTNFDYQRDLDARLVVDTLDRKSNKILEHMVRAQYAKADRIVRYKASKLGFFKVRRGNDIKVGFVAGTQCIGFDSDEIVIAKSLNEYRLLPKDYNEKIVYPEYDIEAVGNYLNSLIRFNRKTPILVIFGILGVLKSVYADAGFPIRFSGYVKGEQSTGKTTATTYCCSMYNRDDDVEQHVHQLTATEARLNQILNNQSDTTIIVDDLRLSDSNAIMRGQEIRLDNLIRVAASNIGKESMRYSYSVNGFVVFTGEYALKNPSTNNRIVLLELFKDELNKDNLRKVEHNPSRLSIFYFWFIQWVVSNYKTVLSIISNESEHYAEMRRGEEPYQERLQGHANQILIAYHILQKFCKDKGINLDYTESDFSILLQNTIDHQVECMELEGKEREDYIVGMYNCVDSRLEQDERNYKNPKNTRWNQELFHDKSRDLVYIPSSTLEDIIEEMKFKATISTVMNDFEAAGLLNMDNSKQHCRTKKLAGKRCYVITFSSWKEYAKNVIEKDISKWNEA